MCEDQADGCRHLADVDDDDQQRGPKVEYDHGRHQSARQLADPPDAADHDHADQRRDNRAGQPSRDREAVFQRGRQGIDLHGVADAERRGGTEHGEGQPQPSAEPGSEFAPTPLRR